uniref:Derlin n=1 Tax=Trichuris muris TaxID=70415 RepID=A0A5S6QWD7_TRIMR
MSKAYLQRLKVNNRTPFLREKWKVASTEGKDKAIYKEKNSIARKKAQTRANVGTACKVAKVCESFSSLAYLLRKSSGAVNLVSMDADEIAKREAVRQKILDNAELRMNKVMGRNDAISPDANRRPNEKRAGVKQAATDTNRGDSFPMKFEPPVFKMSNRTSADMPWYEANSEWLFFGLGILLRLLVVPFPNIQLGLWFLIFDVTWRFLKSIINKGSAYPEHSFLIDMCLSFAFPLRVVVALARANDFLCAVFADSCLALAGFMLTHVFFLCLQ